MRQTIPLEQQCVQPDCRILHLGDTPSNTMLSDYHASHSTPQVIKDPSDPSGPIFIQPTGAPRALVIQSDISAAAGKIHVIQGPLVPASLVSSHLCVDVLSVGFHHHACVAAISMDADGVSWISVHAWGSIWLWVA